MVLQLLTKFLICNHFYHSVPGGYKYGDLALQVGGVSTIGIITYGLESHGTQTREGATK
jgi:hypothetical protein